MKKAKGRKQNIIIAFVLSLLIILSFGMYAGRAFMPSRTDYGACWNMFYCEEKNSIDVLIIGSSVAYCDIKPSVIEKETGRSTYVLGGPELTASLSYYYLVEALKTQSPKTLVLEFTNFLFHEYEGYSKINVGYMKWSANRINATFKACEKELWGQLLFPVVSYHGNQEGVSLKTLIKGRSDNHADPNRGYTKMEGFEIQYPREIRDYGLSDDEIKNNQYYLEKILKLCKDNNIEVKLLSAPRIRYPSEELLEKIAGSICEEFGFDCIDFNADENYKKIGLDDNLDYFDSLHLNDSGAEKFSRALSTVLY